MTSIRSQAEESLIICALVAWRWSQHSKLFLRSLKSGAAEIVILLVINRREKRSSVVYFRIWVNTGIKTSSKMRRRSTTRLRRTRRVTCNSTPDRNWPQPSTFLPPFGRRSPQITPWHSSSVTGEDRNITSHKESIADEASHGSGSQTGGM